MIKLKVFEQTKTGYCGPASLKMVFWYYGKKVSEKELVKKSKTTVALGTREENMIQAIKAFGWHGFWKGNSTINDLRYFLKLKKPVIVAWFSEFEGHYSVVAGIDKKFIHLADPEIGGIKKILVEEFKLIWFDFDGPSVKNPNKWYFEWMLVPMPEKMKFKIKGNYF